MARDWAVHDGDDQLHIFSVGGGSQSKNSCDLTSESGNFWGNTKNTNLLSTHLNWWSVRHYKFCSRCSTTRATVYGSTCMLVSHVLSIKVTSAECSCDCRRYMRLWFADHLDLYWHSTTKLPKSCDHCRQSARISPHIAAVDLRCLRHFGSLVALSSSRRARRGGLELRYWTAKREMKIKHTYE